MRAATVCGSPTSAVPAPPRTRPTPAHRFGLTSSLSRRAAVQRRHAAVGRPNPCARKPSAPRRSASSSTWLISLSAARHAASAVSRTMTCRRMPKVSSAPARRATAVGPRRSSPRPAAGGSPQVRYLSTMLGGDVDAGLRGTAEKERRPRLLHRRIQESAALRRSNAARERSTSSPRRSAL